MGKVIPRLERDGSKTNLTACVNNQPDENGKMDCRFNFCFQS